MSSQAKRIAIVVLVGAGVLLVVPPNEAQPPARRMALPSRPTAMMPQPMPSALGYHWGRHGYWFGPFSRLGAYPWGSLGYGSLNTNYSAPMGFTPVLFGSPGYGMGYPNYLDNPAYPLQLTVTLQGANQQGPTAGYQATTTPGTTQLMTSGTDQASLQQAINNWIEQLQENNSPVVQWRAVVSLGQLGAAAQSAVPDLANMLQAPDTSVRWVAARALSEIGPAAQKAAPALIKALGDPDAGVRLQAATALGRIDPGSQLQQARQALTNLEKDSYPEVSAAATNALARLRQL